MVETIPYSGSKDECKDWFNEFDWIKHWKKDIGVNQFLNGERWNKQREVRELKRDLLKV